MAEYHLQEGTLEIPDLFKDRTMNLFTLSENNASEFTFVVSRATATHEDRVQQVAARLVKELENTVNNFRFESSAMTQIDGVPAIEIYYQFKNGEALIWQKQTIVLLDEEIRGRKMVCYIGTCPDHFSEYYQKQYNAIISSIKFREKEADSYQPVQMTADSSGIWFVLDSDSKCLLVFKELSELHQHVDVPRALNGGYLFFDQKGNPLHIAPVSEQHPVRYGLWTTSPQKAQTLSSLLPVCRSVKGSGSLNDLRAIEVFLTVH